MSGGPKAVQTDLGDILRLPIIAEGDEAAALEVLRVGKMSGLDVREEFEREFAVRGQCGAGWLRGIHVPAYRALPGVTTSSTPRPLPS